MVKQIEEELEISNQEYHQLLYNEVIENIDHAYMNNEITNEEAIEYKVEALKELEERLLEEEEIELEDKYEENLVPIGNYNNQMSLAEFSQQNDNFGSILAELVDEEYEDPEEGLMVLSELTGYDPEDILEIIEGNVIPDEDLVDQLSQAFDCMQDDEVYTGLHLVAEQDREINGLYEEEEEYYEDEEGNYVPLNFDNEEVLQYKAQVDELNNQISEFQYNNDIKNVLDSYILKGLELLDNGMMYPVEFNLLFGELPDGTDEDKLNLFYASSESNDVDPATQLYFIEGALKIFETRGEIFPNGQFHLAEYNSYDPEVAEFNDNLEALAKRNNSLYYEQGHLKASSLM